jgi:hypothetical protein
MKADVAQWKAVGATAFQSTLRRVGQTLPRFRTLLDQPKQCDR